MEMKSWIHLALTQIWLALDQQAWPTGSEQGGFDSRL